MVFGDGDLRKSLGHEGKAFMNGISFLIKETAESSLFFLSYEDTVRRQLSMNQEVGPPHQIPNLLIA